MKTRLPLLKRILILFCLVFLNLFSNAQITWSDSGDVANNTLGRLRPRVTCNANNDAVVLWGRSTDNLAFVAKWNSSSFASPQQVSPPGITIATAFWMGPSIASKGDTVYVAVKRTPETSDTNHIFLVRSFDGGNSFNAGVEVENIGDSLSRFCEVATNEAGQPLVGFMRFDNMFMDPQWVLVRSSDFGSTFSSTTLASGASGGEACDCCPGAITNSGNNVVLAYRDNLNNVRDTYVGISNDGGQSFTQGANVDGGNWNVNMCPSTGPDVAIIGDTLYTVFMSGSTGYNRVYLSKYLLSTSMFVGSELLGGIIPGLANQNYPRIAAHGQALAIVWKQYVSGKDELALKFTSNVSQGFATGYDTLDLNNVVNTDVAISKGKIHVVWEDNLSNTVKYRSGSYAYVESVNEKQNSEVKMFPNPAGNFCRFDGMKDVKEIQIQDLNGRTIHRKMIQSNTETFEINLSTFPSSIYFVRLISNDQTEVRKLIKL